MNKLVLPEDYNYVAVFLTLSCNLSCSYCINLNEFGTERKEITRKPLTADEWVIGLSRLKVGKKDLPITLQGGEPTMHSGFHDIVNGLGLEYKLDLLTNMIFDIDEFIEKIDSEIFTRDAKYAAIRVSYHPGQNDIDDLIAKTKKMEKAGFYVGLYAVTTPENKDHIEDVQKRCKDLGIDFRVKDYLGFDGQEWHGSYKYPEAISQSVNKYCDCKTSELLVAPNGDVFRCHSDLYENRTPVGNIIDPEFDIEDIYRPCYVYGHCNPCDIKVKTNRLQEFGHTSVDIKNIRELTPKEKQKLQNGDFGLGLN